MTHETEIPQGLTLTLGAERVAALRAIRLYHWQERGNWRRVSQGTKDPKFAEVAARYAAWHIAAVQAFDVFFPDPGDTAEADQAKQNERGSS